MDLDAFREWLRRYFDAWASNDPVEVSSLFAVDAVYSYGPFREETRGRDAIVRAWVEGRVPTELRTDVEPIAVSGDRGWRTGACRSGAMLAGWWSWTGSWSATSTPPAGASCTASGTTASKPPSDQAERSA
jgi:hypothetical protein